MGYGWGYATKKLLGVCASAVADHRKRWLRMWIRLRKYNPSLNEMFSFQIKCQYFIEYYQVSGIFFRLSIFYKIAKKLKNLNGRTMKKKVNEIRSARAVLGDVWKLDERGGAIQYLNQTPKCGCGFLLRLRVRCCRKVWVRGVGAILMVWVWVRLRCNFDFGCGCGFCVRVRVRVHSSCGYGCRSRAT